MSNLPVVVKTVKTPVASQALHELFSDADFLNTVRKLTHDFQKKPVALNLARSSDMGDGLPQLMELDRGLRSAAFISEIINAQITFLSGFTKKLPDLKKTLDLEKTRNTRSWQSSQANLAYLKAERYERSLNIFKQMKQSMQGLDLSTAAMGSLYALGIFVGLFNASSLKGVSGQVTTSVAYSTAINSMAQAAIDSALVVSGLKVNPLTTDQALKPLAFYQAMDNALFESVPITNTAVIEQARRGQDIAYGVQFGVQLAVYAAAAIHAARVIALANAGLMTAAGLGTFVGLLSVGAIGAIAVGATTVVIGFGLLPIALGAGITMGSWIFIVPLATPIVMVSAGAALALGGVVVAPMAVFAAAGALALGALGGALVFTLGLTAFVASGLLLSVTTGVSIYFAVQHFQQAQNIGIVSEKYEQFGFNGLRSLVSVFNSNGIIDILMSIGGPVTWILQPFRQLFADSLVNTAKQELKNRYGSYYGMWDVAMGAEMAMLFNHPDFEMYKGKLSPMILDGTMDRVLLLTSQAPGPALRYLAGVIEEGGTLPAVYDRDIQFSAASKGGVEVSLLDGLVDRSPRRSVNIAFGGGSQYVVMEKVSPSWDRDLVRRWVSSYTYESKVVALMMNPFRISDDHSHTTLNLLRLSGPSDLDPKFFYGAELDMGAGNDTVIVGGRRVLGNLGDGFDGLDYSSAITHNGFHSGSKDKLGGISVRFLENDLVTIDKYGSSTIYSEFVAGDTYSYGKRSEYVQYINTEAQTIYLNGERDIFSSVEWIKGSIGFDTMVGNSADNFFVASDGASDTFQGGGGLDWIDYGSVGALEIFVGHRIPTPFFEAWTYQLGTRQPHETLAHILDVGAAKSAGLISSVGEIDNSPGGYRMTLGGSRPGVFIKDNLLGIENLRGGAWNDLIIGSNANNVLIGNGGNDEIYGLGGDDFIATHDGGSSWVYGGEGNDLLDYGSLTHLGIKVSAGSGGSGTVTKKGNYVDTYSGIEAIGGSLGNDTFTGSASDDIFHGNDGNDSFKTGAGNDLITTGRGWDTVDAGDGHDTIVLGRTSGNGRESKTLDGGSGDDVVYYENAAVTPNVGIDADLSNIAKQWVQFDRKWNGSLGAGVDSLTNIEGLGGTRANDRIIGSEAGNRLWGLGGDDFIDGLAGDDFISTGTGQDTVRGGAGNDTIVVERTQLNRGRYVMIRKNEGVNEHLSLAEVQVWSGGRNVAAGRTVKSSGSYDQGQHKAQNLVDGNTGGALSNGIFASAATSGGWVQIDLGKVFNIEDIRFFGRTDGDALGWHPQNGDFTIYVSDRDMGPLSRADIEALPLLSSKRFDGQLSSGSWIESKTIDGGDGLDTVDYQHAQTTSNRGIAADLSNISTQTVQSERNWNGSFGAGSTSDQLQNIENLGATQAHDRITGSASDNRLWGYGGDDFIDGRAGDDVISTGTGQDTVWGGAGNDTIVVERSTGLNGRYIMVRKNADSNLKLTLAEIEVWSGGRNEALSKPVVGACRDGDWRDWFNFSILDDGNTRGGVNDGIYRPRPLFGGTGWVQIDLGKVFNIDEIRFFGATDPQYLNENGDLTIYVSDQNMMSLRPTEWEALPLQRRFDGQMSSGSWDVRQSKTIDGGDGLDTVDYQYAQATSNRGIVADLSMILRQSVQSERNSDGSLGTFLQSASAGVVQSERNRDGSLGAGSTSDRLKNIENLGATRAHDRITGSDSDNRLWGYGGNDFIDGRAGDDVISTGTGQDTVWGGAGNDTILVERTRLNSGRYVMIRKNEGVAEHLSLAEVQVFSGGKNIALGQSLVSSGSYDQKQHKAQNLVDGNTGGALSNGIFASAASSGGWVQIDLGKVFNIEDIRFFGRTDGDALGWHPQNGDFTIYVSDRDMSGLKLAEIEALPLLSSKRFDGQMLSESWIERKIIDGGDGLDTVDYQQSGTGVTQGIVADLSQVSNQTVKTGRNPDGTFASEDRLSYIENLAATDFNDRVIGSQEANKISTFDGDDYIEAQAGNDVIGTGSGKDTVYGGDGDDFVSLEHNLREVELDGQKVQIYADEKFVDGGAGIDFVSHRFQSIQNIRKADTGIVADLGSGRVDSWRNADGTVNDKSARHTLLNIENVGGTEFGDALYGDANANVLVGYEGNDVLAGRLGNDTLVGGKGADVYELSASWGQDVILEDPSSSSDVDVVKLSSDVSYADLWFSKQENHLVVSRLGSSDQLLVQDWYSTDSSKQARVEEFRAGFDGRTFTATLSRVETLVNVMSAYGRPSSPIATAGSLTSYQKAQINSAIATAWL